MRALWIVVLIAGVAATVVHLVVSVLVYLSFPVESVVSEDGYIRTVMIDNAVRDAQ